MSGGRSTDRLAGTGTLLRLALRRDRWTIPWWVLAVAVYAVASAVGTIDLYPTDAQREAFVLGLGSSRATLALYGPSMDLGTLGGLATWKLSGVGAVIVGLMCILLVVRHTRGDEESGRLELVGAGVVGRSAALAAGCSASLIAAALAALGCWIGLWGGGLPAVDSLVFSLGLFAVGAMFTGIAAVTAQLSESARAASGLAVAVLGGSYLLRAIGDGAGNVRGSEWPSWLSPIGWVQQLRPYGPTRWWILGLAAVVTVVLLAAARALAGRRDLGAGLLPPRLGPATAPRRLGSPLALAWRLDRATCAGWLAGLAVFAAAAGAIAGGVTDLVGDNQAAQDLFDKLGGTGALVDSYLATMIGFIAVLVAAFAVQVVLRLHTEEAQHRAEPVLSGAVGRIGWAAGHGTVAAVASAVLLAAAGAVTGLVHGIREQDVAHQVVRLTASTVVQWPAVMVIAAITLLLHGLVPRFATAAWAVLGACVLLGELGPVLELGQSAMDLSPFTHLPSVPGGTVELLPLAGLCGVAAALAGVGLLAFRRRDLLG